ncbi:MAG TPA: LysR family transcriptional regulator [Trebonia sp.]|nr:LysR family transcriptional regulator [Trebonia sp.]
MSISSYLCHSAGEAAALAGAVGIDLNLLAVLGALLEHRNVTRAGERLSLSQPTMSGALARLRQHFGDELLVRSGREYRLTPMAADLLPAVREALGQVERTLSMPAAFDPATSRRRFSIAISAQSILALSGLLRRVHELAPGVRLDTWPITTGLMEAGHSVLGYDVLIGPLGFRTDGDPEVLLRDRIVFVADPANPRLRHGRLTAADLAASPHAMARLPQADAITRALAGFGVTPRVVATTGGWLPLPFLIAGTDLVAGVPERLARRVSGAAGVSVVESPFGTIELVEAAWWHPMCSTDPALTWLRGIISDLAGSLAGGWGQFTPDSLDEQAHLVGDQA